MSDTIIPFDNLYTAKRFSFESEAGQFVASGTLCGCVDVVTPLKGTLCLTIPEIDSLINMLRDARADVVANADPFGDPRLMP